MPSDYELLKMAVEIVKAYAGSTMEHKAPLDSVLEAVYKKLRELDTH